MINLYVCILLVKLQRGDDMDRKDIKMFLLHCENMYILKMLGADNEFIEKLEQRWKDNEKDISNDKEDNH